MRTYLPSGRILLFFLDFLRWFIVTFRIFPYRIGFQPFEIATTTTEEFYDRRGTQRNPIKLNIISDFIPLNKLNR